VLILNVGCMEARWRSSTSCDGRDLPAAAVAAKEPKTTAQRLRSKSLLPTRDPAVICRDLTWPAQTRTGEPIRQLDPAQCRGLSW